MMTLARLIAPTLPRSPWLLAVLALFPVAVYGTTVYKSVDAEGRVHYSLRATLRSRKSTCPTPRPYRSPIQPAWWSRWPPPLRASRKIAWNGKKNANPTPDHNPATTRSPHRNPSHTTTPGPGAMSLRPTEASITALHTGRHRICATKETGGAMKGREPGMCPSACLISAHHDAENGIS